MSEEASKIETEGREQFIPDQVTPPPDSGEGQAEGAAAAPAPESGIETSEAAEVSRPAPDMETTGENATEAGAATSRGEPVKPTGGKQPGSAPAAPPAKRRLRIGSERVRSTTTTLKARPVTTVTPVAAEPEKSAELQAKQADQQEKKKEKPPHKYPPPNVRDRLTPELEAEYMAALGGASLDDLMEDTVDAAAVPAELTPEAKVTGRVAQRHHDDVLVELGGRNQGVVPMRQFPEPPEIGQELELVVVRYNAEEGLYDLSRPAAAVVVGNWDEVVEGQIVEVMVTGVNKGGLECEVASIRGFMPMGQISIYRVEQPEDFVGQKLACVVTEANRDRRNLVLSHRALMERERAENREKLLAELAPGQIREGIVRSLRDFGAFVDLGGIDGLVHVSQLSWDRVAHPRDVVEEGQKIKVRVEKVDPDTGKIGLSYREAGANPWDDVDAKYPVGSRVTGKVSKVMDFGAFVRLEGGVEGLIHISELGHGRVWRASDVIHEGQEVEVKVLSVDREQQRIGLSLKALMARPEKAGAQAPSDEDLAPPPEEAKRPRVKQEQLKGGTGKSSGGEKFGLKW